jgi:hypothetical protein
MTPVPIVTPVKLVQPSNALAPMLVTLLAMDTLVRLVWFKNALAAMPMT